MLTEPKTFLSESISAVDNFLSGKQNIQHLFEFVFVYIFQVRKSFFNDLNINNNVSIVDLLYQQFYTGSDTYPTSEEQDFMRNLFTSEAFVKHEFRYHR